MDAWAWEELQPWLELRVALPVGPLFCVINGVDPRLACAQSIDQVSLLLGRKRGEVDLSNRRGVRTSFGAGRETDSAASAEAQDASPRT